MRQKFTRIFLYQYQTEFNIMRQFIILLTFTIIRGEIYDAETGKIVLGRIVDLEHPQTVYYDFDSNNTVYLLDHYEEIALMINISDYFSSVHQLWDNFDYLKSFNLKAGIVNSSSEDMLNIANLFDELDNQIKLVKIERPDRQKQETEELKNNNSSIITLLIKMYDEYRIDFKELKSDIQNFTANAMLLKKIVQENHFKDELEKLRNLIIQQLARGKSIINVLTGQNRDIISLIPIYDLFQSIADSIENIKIKLGSIPIICPISYDIMDYMFLINSQKTEITLTNENAVKVKLYIPCVIAKQHRSIKIVSVPFTINNATAVVVPKYEFAIVQGSSVSYQNMKMNMGSFRYGMTLFLYGMTNSEREKCIQLPNQRLICNQPSGELFEINNEKVMDNYFVPNCSIKELTMRRKQSTFHPACKLEMRPHTNTILTMTNYGMDLSLVITYYRRYFVYVVHPMTVEKRCLGAVMEKAYFNVSHIVEIAPYCTLHMVVAPERGDHMTLPDENAALPSIDSTQTGEKVIKHESELESTTEYSPIIVRFRYTMNPEINKLSERIKKMLEEAEVKK